ncbi:peptidase M50B-like-domain-containing protein [Rhodotorula diobovata]|uniref:Peptidase M50B-like-domain-containing protein n=1 Tax=Rhodotorula diobovata TaxID=5288 RepID=A0A5C5G2M5_9BASI|nr:peptidase M50B-like-domain-containing protein [Rhodotorula diobovata]
MLLSPASSPSGATRALAVGASFALFAAAATTVSTSALLGTASAPASLNIATCSPILHSVAVDAGAQGLASIEDAGAPRVARSLAVVATGPTPTSFRPTASTFSAVLPPSAAASWAATWSMPTTAAASSLRHGQDLESRRRELGAAASEVTMNGAASVVAAAEGEPLRDEDDQQRMRERRWEGWETSTSTVWVTNTEEVPKEVTIYTTYGESPVVDGGVITETVYRGASTLTVPGPSYLTITFYPTTTTYQTSRTTIPTTTKTKTQTPGAAASSTPTVCNTGDADEKEFHGLKPTHDESITLYVIAICAIVGIGIGWNLFILRDLLYPFKVFTVAVHEMGHVLVTICLGGHIGLFCIDPKVGGLTRQAIGDDRELPLPFATLPAGYLLNILVGGVLTFCGFNTLASKIASFIVGLCWIGVFLRVEVVAKLMTLLAVGLMIGLWFVEHAWGLRFYILFLGVMLSFYVLWDVADDAFFAKQNPSCPYLHWEGQPALSPALWTIIWVLVSFLLFVGFVLAALATWKQSPHAMYCQAQTFLPTR